MKALKIIGVLILLLVITFYIIVSGSPAEGQIEDSIVINAPVEVVYEEVINIKKLDAWSPWYNLDPDAYTYEGPAEGVGATSKWDSENSELRKGSITIVEATPNQGIKTDMVFDGIDGKFNSWVHLESQGDQTKVTWGYSYSGLGTFWRFIFGLGDTEAEMRPKFEKGLADLKAIAEAKPIPEPEAIEISPDSTEVTE